MKRRWLIALTGSILAAAIIITIRYKSASMTAAGYHVQDSTANHALATQKVGPINPDVLLAFADGFRQRDNEWARFYMRLYPKLPAALQKRLVPPKPARSVWDSTMSGFMSQSGDDVRPVLPKLMQMLAESNNPARFQILVAANRLLNAQDKDYVPRLISLLQDTNVIVRIQAIDCLGRIGPEAKAAIPALTAAINDREVYVRVASAKTLWKIQGTTNVAVAVMKEAVDSGEKWAAISLHEIAPDDVTLIPVFIQMLNGRDYNLQMSSAEALGGYGPAASDAVPALVKAVESKKSYLRDPALRSLKKIDPDAAAKYEAQK